MQVMHVKLHPFTHSVNGFKYPTACRLNHL